MSVSRLEVKSCLGPYDSFAEHRSAGAASDRLLERLPDRHLQLLVVPQPGVPNVILVDRDSPNDLFKTCEGRPRICGRWALAFSQIAAILGYR